MVAVTVVTMVAAKPLIHQDRSAQPGADRQRRVEGRILVPACGVVHPVKDEDPVLARLQIVERGGARGEVCGQEGEGGFHSGIASSRT